ncbi:MAG TPA: cytochrome c peroxidase [Bacteroidia bacterium]|nr:cytochrome c peroxidase [Bacteroidia bacterium]
MKVRGYLLFLLVLLGSSCKKRDDTPQTSFTPYEIQIPKQFPVMEIPADNAMSVERLQLGRKLYYDTILSNNGKSCASCHYQPQGFTSDNVPDNNVLPHQNLGWSHNFLWKGEKNGTLEDIMMFEVNIFFGTDISKLNANGNYRELFYTAYGVKEIASKDVAYALAQFFRILNSGNSKYDKYRRHELALTQNERNGMIIFFTEKGDCFHCHNEIFLTDNAFHNTGLDSAFDTGHKGRYDVTDNANDIGKYKTPTLRNCELRNRFMHDGRYTTLEEVIEFYNSGVKQTSVNIDPLMTLPYKENGLQLTQQEKDDLLLFLQTLTDTSFINDYRLGKPQ